ncbi:MAG: hypothetical protein ACUVSX_16945 [Aggregatilineales bacterium]
MIAAVMLASACAGQTPESTPSFWDAPPPTLTPTATAPPMVVPTTAPPTATAAPSPTAPATALPADAPPAESPLDFSNEDGEFVIPRPDPFEPGSAVTEFGVQINGCDRDVPLALSIARRMGMTWIKQQARWGDMQPAPWEVDWSCLDRVIPAARAAGFKVLISVTTAPAFTRVFRDDTLGPPDNLETFGLFIAGLIARYPGAIQAVEMWNEPNLSAEWSDYIDAVKYKMLLAMGYAVVKSIDPSIMVISAGIAPTPQGSRWEHMDDLLFLGRMLEYDGASYMDCLGAHANGPLGVGELPIVAERYYGFVVERTAEAYGESFPRPLCFTEFSYALPVEGRAPEGFEWVMGHSEAEQVQRYLEWMAWARASGYVKLAIVFNLNYDGGPDDPNAVSALVRPGWVSPAVDAIGAWLGSGARP